MTCNVGGGERTMRFGAAALLASLAMLPRIGAGYRAILLGLAAVNATTAGLRYCPLNQAIGRGSCSSAH